jgi:hypothetical protein
MIAPVAGEYCGMRVFVIVALIIAGGCQAPRAHSDPRLVSKWLFQAPRGWAEAKDQTWRSSSTPELVSLQIMPERRPRDLREILNPYNTTYSRVTLCRGVPALFAKWRPWFGQTIQDEIATQQSGSIAIASYYYQRSYNPDAEAERSIRSLCPKAYAGRSVRSPVHTPSTKTREQAG